MQYTISITWLVCVLGLMGAVAAPASAAPHELRLALHNGKLHTPDLAAAICREMHVHVFQISGGDIELTSERGSLCIRSFNDALGGGCQLKIDQNVLILHVDPDKLPRHVDDAKRAIRIFTTEVAPEAAATQAAHWGLFLPENFDQRRPLVVLIHGLESERIDMTALGQLLAGNGYQVGYFVYPNDQPIEESGDFLARQMKIFREKYPAAKVDIIAHSMGGLVARAYVEGHAFGGEVDRLIMVGTPNAGSSWAAGELLLKINQEYHDRKTDPQWRWTWAITNGLGEAGRDLKPHSKFLDALNSNPRRAGVKYTIIAGNSNLASRLAVDATTTVLRSVVPSKAKKLWGLRQCATLVVKCTDKLRHQTGNSDGPVNIESAKLAGVDDVVILPADHGTLICFDHGNPPAAWPVIKDRLAK